MTRRRAPPVLPHDWTGLDPSETPDSESRHPSEIRSFAKDKKRPQPNSQRTVEIVEIMEPHFHCSLHADTTRPRDARLGLDRACELENGCPLFLAEAEDEVASLGEVWGNDHHLGVRLHTKCLPRGEARVPQHGGRT